jgi:hypothetical protein
MVKEVLEVHARSVKSCEMQDISSTYSDSKYLVKRGTGYR